MRRLAWLAEDFAEWDTGVWVHYSKEPFLKVNPRQLHQDPAGIYFFPEKFEAKGQWRLFPHKFRASVDRLNVLDLSKLSGEDAADIYEKVVPEGARKLSREDFVARPLHPSPDPASTLWDALREHFVLGKGRQGGQAGFGAWNRALRNAGYDAVFDDTGAIHAVEVQLIVLDPTKVDVIERVDQRSSGFDEMGEVTKALADLLASYGTVKVEEPRRRRGMWSSSSTKLSASVRVEKVGDPDTYASWGIEPVFSGGDVAPASKDTMPREIRVYLEYSSPSLGYGAGASVEMGRRELDMGEMRRNVRRDMDAVWEKAAKEPAAVAASLEPPTGVGRLWGEAGAFTDPTGRYWGDAGVGGIFYAEDTGRYLVSKRSPHVNEPNTWGTWGGKIERGETAEGALAREVREETGYSGPYRLEKLHTYADGDFKFHNYLIVVPAEFEPRHSWETSDHRWVDRGDWPEPLHFGLRALVPHIRRRPARLSS